MLRQSASAALVVVLMAACESSPTPSEPSEDRRAIAHQPAAVAKPNPSFQPFAFAVDNCVETVDLTGTFHGVTQSFVGPGGKEHFRFHINAKGTGVGRLTGSRYQWNDRLFDVTNITPRGSGTFTQNDYARLIGQGSAVNTVVTFQAKLTVNGQGVVTVNRITARSRCG
jgi:hypothetical protein